MFDLALETMLILVAAAFIAGFIDSIAGGGGLITVPALLIAGLPPVDALGTNKLQGLFGSTSATIAYASKGLVDVRAQWLAALMSFLGSIVGALLATVVPSDWLRLAMPVLLIAIAVYFAVKPNMDDVDRAQRMAPLLFNMTVVPLIGLYDGIFGPGTGSFFMLAYVSLAGFGVLKATAHTKLLNMASNVGAFAVFSMAGAIWFKVGLVMGVAQFIGARFGAAMAVRNGARLIKPLLIVTCVALALRLMLDPTNPLRLMLGF